VSSQRAERPIDTVDGTADPARQGRAAVRRREGSAPAAPWLALLAAAACTPGGDSSAGERRSPPPSIVLVTIDTLRADHLGCYGYFRDTSPRIDAFAREALVFDQAYATMATTLPSHASIFTARYPLEHGILANVLHGGNAFGWKEGMLSFAEVARDAGYATAGFVSAAPVSRDSGIDAGFDTWTEPAGIERRGDETAADALAWLASANREPFFLWVHLYDPHWKYEPPPPYDSMFETEPELKRWIAERGIDSPGQRRTLERAGKATRDAINAYCGEVRFADEQVGRLLDALRERELLDRSIVVVTSDHGEGLNQHDWSAHGLVWDEQLRVPLLIRFPSSYGVAPRRVGELVSLIDLFPTLLGRMGPLGTAKERDFLAQATGADVLAPGFAERPLFAQRSGRELPEDPGEMRALTTREWKLVEEVEVGHKLFDRRADPHELADLSALEPRRLQRLRDLAHGIVTEQARRSAEFAPAPGRKVDPAFLEKLKELGYAGGDDGRYDVRGDDEKPPGRRGRREAEERRSE
jgi:arylsulfatase